MIQLIRQEKIELDIQQKHNIYVVSLEKNERRILEKVM